MMTALPPGPRLDAVVTSCMEPGSTEMIRTMTSRRGENRWRLTGKAIAAGCGGYVSGRLSQRIALGLVGPLVILSFGVAVALGIAYFPTSYDFRRQWVSALASAQDNPSGYFYFGVGLSIMALLLVPVPGYFAARLRRPGKVCAGVPLLWTGIAGALLLGLTTAFFPELGSRRSVHQLFTVMTFFGLTPGFLYFATRSVSHAWTTRSNGWLAWLGCAVLSVPVIGAGLTRFVLDFGAHAFGWASTHEARQLAPFFLRMAFWEWVAVASLWVGGYLALWAASLLRSAEALFVAESRRAGAGEPASPEQSPLTAGGRLYSSAPTAD